MKSYIGQRCGMCGILRVRVLVRSLLFFATDLLCEFVSIVLWTAPSTVCCTIMLVSLQFDCTIFCRSVTFIICAHFIITAKVQLSDIMQ